MNILSLLSLAIFSIAVKETPGLIVMIVMTVMVTIKIIMVVIMIIAGLQHFLNYCYRCDRDYVFFLVIHSVSIVTGYVGLTVRIIKERNLKCMLYLL